MATVLERPVETGAVSDEALDAVAVKALPRLFAAWELTNAQAARLANVGERTWSRMRSGEWAGSLDEDQRLRASGLVGLYKALHVYFSDALADQWPKLPNRGSVFRGQSPLEFMLAGGLPAILRVRNYVDALRGGA